MTRAHSDLRITDFVVAIDNAEQLPWTLEVAEKVDGHAVVTPLRTVSKSLETGDYSIVGAEDLIAVERKSFPDLIGCIGNGRKRFDKEIQRLLSHPSRCVIVEAHISQLELGQWRGEVTVAAAIGSVMGWIEKGVPFIFAGDRRAAALYCARFLYVAARRRFRELQAFQNSLKIAGGSDVAS